MGRCDEYDLGVGGACPYCGDEVDYAMDSFTVIECLNPLCDFHCVDDPDEDCDDR